MKHVIALTTAALLGACGIDGEPSSPEPQAATKTGVTITGRAEVGAQKKW
ncbi:argininosuccinate lyase [uncultured Litoreibacter sp.]|nr:argininosuccinate lyase [uncultured Litoreibacter sp.]